MTDNYAKFDNAKPKMKGKLVEKEIVIEKKYKLELTEEQIARIIRLGRNFEGGDKFPTSSDQDDLRIATELAILFPELSAKATKYSNLSWADWKEKF